MLESGTKTLSLPSELYGCPYPPNPALPKGTCAAPDLCNCNAGICFGTCKGMPCPSAPCRQPFSGSFICWMPSGICIPVQVSESMPAVMLMGAQPDCAQLWQREFSPCS